jgi:RimJ/RimL family protein N-acetyltransferase
MEPFVLANELVRLSAPGAADVERVYELCQDPETQRWVPVPSPYLRADAEAFVTGFVPRGWESGHDLNWAIRAPGDVLPGEAEPPLLGMVGIRVDGAGTSHASGEFGYWIGPTTRGQGLVTEAARLVVDYALDPEGLGLGRVEWRAVVGNWASRRVAWKLGVRVEGEVRGLLVHRGERRDGWIGTLLAGDPREPNEPWPADAPAGP